MSKNCTTGWVIWLDKTVTARFSALCGTLHKADYAKFAEETPKKRGSYKKKISG